MSYISGSLSLYILANTADNRRPKKLRLVQSWEIFHGDQFETNISDKARELGYNFLTLNPQYTGFDIHYEFFPRAINGLCNMD